MKYVASGLSSDHKDADYVVAFDSLREAREWISDEHEKYYDRFLTADNVVISALDARYIMSHRLHDKKNYSWSTLHDISMTDLHELYVQSFMSK
jgi:hypothetical protein